MVNRVISIIILFRILIYNIEIECNNFYINIIISVSILFKLGIWPFTSWVYEISNIICYNPFILFITLQKIPILILILSFFRDVIFLFSFLNLFFGSILLIYRSNFKNLLIRSSVYNYFWMLIFIILNYFLFFFFFFLIVWCFWLLYLLIF